MIAFLTKTCYGQGKINIQSDFIEISPPKTYSYDWYISNQINNQVKVNDGTLNIRKICNYIPCELKISTGTLYGLSGGEWGGLLVFVPFTDPKNFIEKVFGNITSIFLFKNEIYIMAAIGFWDATGAIYKLKIEENNNFIYEKVLDFDDVPLAQTIYKDKLLIVTSRNFYIVNDFKKELIVKNTFWGYLNLHPNSVAAINDKNVFVGMRGGIAKLNLKTRKLKFYKNTDNLEQGCIDDNSAVLELLDNKIYKEEETNLYSQLQFPGGRAAMLNYIHENINFPPEVAEMGIKGKMVCGFVVENNGKINKVEILKPLNKLMDEEVVRVVKGMPSWTPGRRAGRPIRVYCTIQIDI